MRVLILSFRKTQGKHRVKLECQEEMELWIKSMTSNGRERDGGEEARLLVLG